MSIIHLSLVDGHLDCSKLFCAVNNTGTKSLARVSLETWTKVSIVKNSLLKKGITGS